MCDDLTEADNQRFLADAMTRRGFGAAAAAAGVAVLLPMPANALATKGRDVTITTPDGTADAYFVAPAAGKHPAVLVWPDIMGLRPAFRQMADRLAQSGYAVLTVNQFYRSTRAPFVTPGQGFDAALGEKVGPWRKLLTAEATSRDARAFVAWLDRQRQVDRKRGIGSTGYCMGGPMVMLTAAGAPARVRAGATFHGGGMAADDLLARVPQMKAHWLVAIAANDDARAPGDKDKLRAAFAAARQPAEIEVYQDTMHGWCPPDSQVYNQAQAERAWGRLLHLLRTSLG
ncbi:dienelactone hydrolase family protein [Sphingomonas psychrotolerans]|uniref:Dienelactone hydrolase family protein n=1 Tax=Sphingomonas psychrotolerans TaxID=1327635 RepID=A0ABU3N6N4_9SPHN|nr:dienelactone hydrolase family protein [Sphingomonas psychrotolerans]MDT8759951.1 dienelactone hydrolase family protein [Sphingomonas psychrotolerans]